MKVGDLVKCRARSPEENYDAWLGIIIKEIPGYAEYKTVQWINSEDGGELHTVNHKAKDLFKLNENR